MSRAGAFTFGEADLADEDNPAVVTQNLSAPQGVEEMDSNDIAELHRAAKEAFLMCYVVLRRGLDAFPDLTERFFRNDQSNQAIKCVRLPEVALVLLTKPDIFELACAFLKTFLDRERRGAHPPLVAFVKVSVPN